MEQAKEAQLEMVEDGDARMGDARKAKLDAKNNGILYYEKFSQRHAVSKIFASPYIIE